ncbi:hypothetical protein [Kitasatospora sp. MAP5-34]|uniref:hypothetical protein n=1 Tax=Kitasatospora sp. MAP5-34 TaxID=3035102 RepID=UPI00247342DA|nr:hypothetical protein [Kitasatospora sp. MAP5-34]MDH6574515.1 hypothetical protein [Kitasatospora sp. MAP5-34]
MKQQEGSPATVRLVNEEGHVNPGVTASGAPTGSVYVDSRGWVWVKQDGRPLVSYPPHMVARIEWETDSIPSCYGA